ncbi:hypothetical protein BY458DRAFT_551481 [Sporodiniella umbellata]|nr:hypothetical protein BY458DRAFT_551481 [Sporodiniella umbellata]
MMPPSIPNLLLDGKLLTGVLPLEKQPPVQQFLPHHNQLLDIESCIDDPSLAPLGHHVQKKKPAQPKKSIKRGQVHIQRSDLSYSQSGIVMLRRRRLDDEQLTRELSSLLPPLTMLLKNADCYTHIVELDISRNKLSRLPSQIVYLKQLRVLNVMSNRLSDISTELLELEHLQVLNLSQNQIKSLPPEMPNLLCNLVTLRIAANQINQLPSTIDQWLHMKHLQLGSVYGGNQLIYLPENITYMPQLEELDVSFNQLRALPDHFVLPSLAVLNVSNNHLDVLPKSIALCNQLKSLNVSKNHLTSLPSVLMNLRQLELFDISENLLCIMPAGILEKMASTALLIGGNPLTQPGHCNPQRSSQGAYSNILTRMTQRAVSYSPIHSPSTSRLDVSRIHQDEDATIDHELSYHAQQLNIYTSSYTDYTPHPILLDHAALVPPETQLLPSLREWAARALLSHQIPYDSLPEHLAQDFKCTQTCCHCHQPFVNEWVTSVQVKSFGGHPAVVRRVSMFTPSPIPKNNTISPKGAFRSLIDVVKSIQLKGEQEFTVFYEKLMSSLSPTSTISKKTVLKPLHNSLSIKVSHESPNDKHGLFLHHPLAGNSLRKRQLYMDELEEEAKRLEYLEAKISVLKRQSFDLGPTQNKRITKGHQQKHPISPDPVSPRYLIQIGRNSKVGLPKRKQVLTCDREPFWRNAELPNRIQTSDRKEHVSVWSEDAFWTTPTYTTNTPSFNEKLKRAKMVENRASEAIRNAL